MAHSCDEKILNMNLRPRKPATTPTPFINKSKAKCQISQQLLQRLMKANKEQAQLINDLKQEHEQLKKQCQNLLDELDIYKKEQSETPPTSDNKIYIAQPIIDVEPFCVFDDE